MTSYKRVRFSNVRLSVDFVAWESLQCRSATENGENYETTLQRQTSRTTMSAKWDSSPQEEFRPKKDLWLLIQNSVMLKSTSLFIMKNCRNSCDSPTQLKNKIIVKGKKLKSDNPDSGEVSDEDESAESGMIDIEESTSQSSEASEKKKKKKSVIFKKNFICSSIFSGSIRALAKT